MARRANASEEDQAELEALRPPLMRFFLRRVRDRAEAEDLTQETFARLISSSRARDICDPQSFLFQVAINLLRDRGRMAQRRGQANLGLVDPHRISAISNELVEDIHPERVLQGRADVRNVVLALGELNERTRDIYVLFRLENMKQAEIAALFGISRSTVEKEVMKATLHLATRFGRSGR